MRPVSRGSAPRVYKKYGDAIGDLEDRMGTYCSYCERRLPVSLAVEHVAPKYLKPALENKWENFLLGCTKCNSVKKAQPTNKTDFLWPDLDNTLRAYTYSIGGFVQISAGLTVKQERRAEKLRDLVGLNRYDLPGHPAPAPRDKRWQQRKDAWDAAVLAKEKLRVLGNSVAARDLVLIAAEAAGFFSVWMTVFSDNQDIRQGLISKMKGTAIDCFDADFAAVKRPGGRL